MTPESKKKIEEAAKESCAGYSPEVIESAETEFEIGATYGYNLCAEEYDAGERARFIQSQSSLIQMLNSTIKDRDAELEEFKRRCEYQCQSCWGVGEVGHQLRDGSYENHKCGCIELIEEPLLDKISQLEDKLYHSSREVAEVEYMLNHKISQLEDALNVAEEALEGADRRFRHVYEKTITDPADGPELRARAAYVFRLADVGYNDTSKAITAIRSIKNGENKV